MNHNRNIRKRIFRVLKNLKPILSVKMYLKFKYAAYTGKRLSFSNPIEFNEKLNWLKVYYHPPIITQLADKFEVRKYVNQKIGSQYLNKVFYVYFNEQEFVLKNCPKSFILKGVQGSKTNFIVMDKNDSNETELRKIIKKFLSHNQYEKVGYEWAYKNIIPKVICEELMFENGKKFLTDYKFYCFNGKPEFIQVISDIDNIRAHSYFDLEWKLQEFHKGSEKLRISNIEKPKLLTKMIELATLLAGNFPFVRVDFYYLKEKIYFGEMTFYPSDGKTEFYPDKYNKIFGEKLHLPQLEPKSKEITIYEP